MLAPQTRPDLPETLFAAIARGARGHCPRCGKAALFRAFLKPVDHCAACHQDWTLQRADDFPPYISIFLTGHVMAPLIIYFGAESPIPLWASLAICLALAAALMLALLQPAKGATIALQWWHGMHGFNPSGHDEAKGEVRPAGEGPWS